MSERDEVGEVWTRIFEAEQSRSDGLASAHEHLVRNGLLNKVTLLQYRCRRGHLLATVYGVAGNVLCATSDYKLSPGLNGATSVPAARAERTLDKDDRGRHWPGHVHDVRHVLAFGLIPVTCRDLRGTIDPADILAAVERATPGRPIKPIILGRTSE